MAFNSQTKRKRKFDTCIETYYNVSPDELPAVLTPNARIRYLKNLHNFKLLSLPKHAASKMAALQSLR